MSYFPAGAEQYEDVSGFFSFIGKAVGGVVKAVTGIGGGGKVQVSVGGKPIDQVLKDAVQAGIQVNLQQQQSAEQQAAAMAQQMMRQAGQVPTWVWIAGAGAVALALSGGLGRRRRRS